MHTSRLLPGLFGFVLVLWLPHGGAQAAPIDVTYVSGTGLDANPCTRAQPCRTLQVAFNTTNPNGTIVTLDAAEYGTVFITQPVSIINDNAGTAAVLDTAHNSNAGTATVVITAGPTAVVTLRGLALNSLLFVGLTVDGVFITNAHQVNIEHCTIYGQTGVGILVTPNLNGQMQTLASTINVKIEDTVVTGSAGGVRIASVPGVTVNAAISRSSFENNNGGGIRIDGTSGGTITASISDSVSSMNAGNGIVALSGPGNVAVNTTRSVFASNVASGVQSNATSGGTSTVTVNSSTITNNAAGQVNFFGGATLLTFGDNRVVGTTGTGFSGAIGLQ